MVGTDTHPDPGKVFIARGRMYPEVSCDAVDVVIRCSDLKMNGQ